MSLSIRNRFAFYFPAFLLIALSAASFPNRAFSQNCCTVEFQFSFGSEGMGDGEFERPTGIALGPDSIYVSDVDTDRIQVFDTSGNFVAAFGSEGTGAVQFITPTFLVLDSEANTYVSDNFNERVQVISPNNLKLKFQFNVPVPEGIALDSAGNIYVASSNDSVKVYDSTGNLKFSFGKQGSGEGEFNNPMGLALDDSGNIYVADTDNNRIQVFDSTGGFLFKFGSNGSANGQMVGPQDVTVDSLGYIYVSDSLNGRVQIFNSSGQYQSKFNVSNGESLPAGITIDDSGNLYVVDTANDRVDVYSVQQPAPTDGNNGSPGGGCALAGANMINGASSLLALFGYLLIPGMIVVKRRFRRR